MNILSMFIYVLTYMKPRIHQVILYIMGILFRNTSISLAKMESCAMINELSLICSAAYQTIFSYVWFILQVFVLAHTNKIKFIILAFAAKTCSLQKITKHKTLLGQRPKLSCCWGFSCEHIESKITFVLRRCCYVPWESRYV